AAQGDLPRRAAGAPRDGEARGGRRNPEHPRSPRHGGPGSRHELRLRRRAAALMSAEAREAPLGDWRSGPGRSRARFAQTLDRHRVRLALEAPSGVLRRKEIDVDDEAAAIVVRYDIAASE